MMPVYKIIISLILLFTSEIFTETGIASTEQIIEKNNCDLDRLVITDKCDAESLVTHYQINVVNRQQIISEINAYLDHSCNNILASIYLSHVLYHEILPENTLQRLESFKNKNPNNCLPYFLLSYYYFRRNDFKKSELFLKKANEISGFNDFTFERQRISKTYLRNNNQSLFCSYLHSMFILTNYPVVPTARDADESTEILKFIQGHFDIQEKAREGYSGYSSPGTSLTNISIYKMTSETAQNDLVKLLKAEKNKRGWRPVKITFYEKELLLKSGNVTFRGPEKVLRTVKIW